MATVQEPAAREPVRVDKAQYALAAVLALVGIYTIIDARGLTVGFGDPVGPRVFPYVIGAGMILLAVMLAVATARGDVAEGEKILIEFDQHFFRFYGVIYLSRACPHLKNWF